MLRKALTLAVLALGLLAIDEVVIPDLAAAQVLPPRATVVSATSGNVANAAATATMAAPSIAGQSNYLCGFQVRSLGATAASTVALTVTGLVGGTMTFQVLSVAGATTQNPPVDIALPICAQGTPDTAVVVSLPALGAGNTNAMVNAWGYRY